MGQQTKRSENDPVGRRFFSDSDKPICDAVEKTANERGIPMAQVGLAWVLNNPVVTALDVRLTDDEIQTLEDPYTLRQPSGYS